MPFTPVLPRLIQRLRRLAHWDRTFSKGGQRRITVVSQFFPPDFAATGQLLDDLTARLASTGLQVQVLSGMPAYAFNQADAPPVEFQAGRVIFRSRASRFWPKRIRGRAVNGLLYCLRTSLRLLKYARRGDLIIYTTEPPYLPVVGWIVHRLTCTPLFRSTPYVLILYDLYPDVLVELGVLKERHWFTRFWRECNRYAYRSARDIVVLSETMRRRVEFFTPDVASRITVIPSWADTDAIMPRAKSDNWFVQRYGLQNTFNVLYSGNQGRCHDLVTLMGAAMLLRRNPTIRFVFIGNGAQNERIRSLAVDWGLTNCLFLPYQEYEVLPWSLSCADVAVVSLGITSVGLVAPSKIYGHMAAGTPVALISPHDSDLRDLIDGKLGGWFSNGDGEKLANWIESLSSDQSRLETLGASSRRLAMQQFSGSSAAEAYLKLITR